MLQRPGKNKFSVMHSKLVFALVVSLWGVVAPQSFSFQFGFDDASPSSFFNFGSPFTDTGSSSRGTPLTASGGAAAASQQQQQPQQTGSESSFVFSGLGDQTTPTVTQHHRQPQQQTQRQNSRLEQQQPELQPKQPWQQQPQQQSRQQSPPRLQPWQQQQSRQQPQPQPTPQPTPQPKPQPRPRQQPQLQPWQQPQPQAHQQPQVQPQQQQDQLLRQQQQRQQHELREQQKQQHQQLQLFDNQSAFTDIRKQSSSPQAHQNEVVPQVTIGRSPCPRGQPGQQCRSHLIETAMACTSGKCRACQQCSTVGASEWISCCRDHFLCCRPLTRSCQRCDQPSLFPFCDVAFGKCN